MKVHFQILDSPNVKEFDLWMLRKSELCMFELVF